jgi:hypothetical protein
MVRILHDPSLDNARLWNLAALFGLSETLTRKPAAMSEFAPTRMSGEVHNGAAIRGRADILRA